MQVSVASADTSQQPVPASAPRQRLIAAASRLFCRYGINATGIDAVVAEAGTAKTTLYKLFGSKDALVEAVLEQEGRLWRDWFLGRIESDVADGAARIAQIFPVLREWFVQERFFGCPFINAIGEHDKQEDRLRALTLRHKTLVLSRIEAWARDARVDAPARFAHQIAVLMDGAIVAAMVMRDPSSADHAGHAAAALLVQAQRSA